MRYPLRYRVKAPIVRILVGILLVLAASNVAQSEDDFQPLLTDSPLTGWVRTNTPDSTWKFEDGVLYCTGKPIGEIRTAKMYQNFVMELQWRHMVPRGNAGIFVWADDITSRGVPFHRGIEVQVLENDYGNNQSHTTHGDIFPIHGATMTPFNGRGGSRAFPTEFRSKPAGQWNHYRIECRDGEVSLAVNGKVVTRGKDCVPRKGYICLESEGGVVEYRDVKIRELPATEIAPEHIAIADRGYESLYSGLDLEGWSAEQPQAWQSNDWVLAYQGTAGQRGKLTSAQSFGDLSFVVDVRLKDPASTVAIHAGPVFQIDLQDPRWRSQLQPEGRWNRIEAVSRGGKHSVVINGHETPFDGGASGESAPLVLMPTGPVDFCNVYASTRQPPDPEGQRCPMKSVSSPFPILTGVNHETHAIDSVPDTPAGRYHGGLRLGNRRSAQAGPADAAAVAGACREGAKTGGCQSEESGGRHVGGSQAFVSAGPAAS
ncbi:DUF1080 domain-containing protein [Roseiconus nitratireducens]|uniref:DUF1080 domain-containing protein n=2 Tax=Roseiconus nitratireducens TaxID=2605748 RepID=A0A5M6D482_9BACT|nr:DUF1080 domain-containing protein [Roseiconus nitratireducens]